MKNSYDEGLPATVSAIRQSVESLLGGHPEGNRTIVTDLQDSFLGDLNVPVGFDVWELDDPPVDGEHIRILARLTIEDTLLCVSCPDGFLRSQTAFSNPNADLARIVRTVIDQVERGLIE